MSYRCVYSRDGFVHYLVTGVICRGYWFYVTGRIPDGKDATIIDQKLIEKYDCAISKSARWRRKKLGKANVRYLRCGRFFVLFATKGVHRFFEEEANIHDIRKIPLKFSGYSISFRRDGRPSAKSQGIQYRVHVRIESGRHKELIAEFERIAICSSTEWLVNRLSELPYQNYAPVRRQLLTLHRKINHLRRRSGRNTIPKGSYFLNRARRTEASVKTPDPQPEPTVPAE